MIEIENFINNDQWYIGPSEARKIVGDGNLLDYKFCNTELNKICRWDNKKRKLIKLNKTVNFQFLANQKSKKAFAEYAEYCKKPANLADNKNRSPDNFINLYKKILKEGYDPKKGVIVVDQYDTVIVGLHRACILLYIGELAKIPVVKVNIKSSRLHKIPFLIPVYKVFNYIRKRFNG